VSALEELIDQDELREQIIERAAEKALARWRPPEDEDGRRAFDAMLQGQADDMVTGAIEAQIREPVSEAIARALDGEFQPTDAYGGHRSGPKRTLREVIATRVEEQIKLPDNRAGYSSGRSDTALGEWLEREVKGQVKKQLWADFHAIADAVSQSAAEAIQGNLKYLLKNKVKR
jgi:hypothetical protein